MRRRRKSTSSAQDLRHLALAGRWQEVRELLEKRLARNPEDAEARSELERLRQGLPLRATESALARQRREEQEMQEELAAELALYRSNPAMVEEWDAALLTRRRKRVRSILATLGNRLPDEEAREAKAYLATLTELWANNRTRKRRFRFLVLGLPLLALAAAAAFTTLHHQASRAERALREALTARDPARVAHSLALADSGVNRLINAEMPELIRQARLWQERLQRQEAELREALAALETGQERISTLPLPRRAALESALRTLPTAMDELRQRWKRLCKKEEQALAAQREELRQHFLAPLPALPEFSGNPAEDDTRLKQQQQELRQLEREWEAARSLFNLPQTDGEALQARLRQLRELREEVNALRRCIALLPSARTYAQYRRHMEQLSPQHYPPALQLTAIRDRLPDEAHLRDLMQNHGHQLPPGMLEAARHALLDGGPSFPPAFPANAQQVQHMEDLFTYTGLHKVLHEMSAPTLPSVIVEELPEVSEQSVSFTPSPLSPGYSLDTPRRITWLNPQGVFIRRIDATPLLRESGITREDFFSRGNLPRLLCALLRVEHAECPELARAFVFKRLLDVMRDHEWPTMFGLAYAPTLRADIRSFNELIRELGLTLEAGCWLQDRAGTAQAEERLDQWFRERRHRQYAQEIARNFAALVQVHPRYVGFIRPDGGPQLFRQLPEGTLLWYLTREGLSTTPQGELPEAPIPFSPVFVVAKD